MCTTDVSRRMSLWLASVCVVFCCLLGACMGGPGSTSPGSSAALATQEAYARLNASVVPTSTFTLPDAGVAASIPVSSHPDITVESGNATHLTFVGAATQTISTNLYALPYAKKANAVTISFGQNIGQALVITIPRQASLSVTLTTGNVVVESVQGQVDVTLASGTIQLKNFSPRGTDTLSIKSGTIGVTFAQDASCSLKAQTDFGAIVSGYASIAEKRTGMRAEAAGSIHGGTGAIVSLATVYGSISIGPA